MDNKDIDDSLIKRLNEQYNDMTKEFSQSLNQQTCPSCGYCPTCKRKNQYNQYASYPPIFPNYFVTYGTSNENTQTSQQQ